ncbi:FGGY-family carbohydrate kinase [Martelella mediterranea]|uniref:L-xylulose/3-keto-L-gulonate kinase n=1 Tax=Martelella mediterranea DSM 17316 TaxID=1122214 RepID=A0A1U9Z7W6_9HYPH|nr:FGGY-family carbohydrate kinase [Martelella mediterranea]AQZ53809.1 L-xylulose/3-keto-L-gulonate kinase [Martelella mediterranea DSM 17316]
MADLFLSIDAGGTAVKAAVFDAEGRLVASRAIDILTIHRDNGWVEREPEAFWRGTAKAIRELTARDIDAERIAAVACTGFGNGVFLVDGNGRATRDGIVSVDHRAQPIVAEFLRDGTAGRIEAITGHQIWGGQTLMQLVWLARNEPAVVACTRWALACKDYLRMRLTGVASTDPTDASGGGLFELEQGGYSNTLFEVAGIGVFADRMPPVIQNSGIAGLVSRVAAEETGLREGTPVAAAMMDVSACVLGAGSVGAETLTMIAGTWSINGLETDRPISRRPPILNMIHRDRTCRLLADGSPTSAANLNWFISRAMGGQVNLSQANGLVENSPVEALRCHFMPFVSGPAPRRGAFVGMTNVDDQGSMLRAIFEGVAFQHRRHGANVVDYVAPQAPSRIRLAGGASKSAVWTRIFADVCGLPVEVPEGDEIGALGAAMCAAVATGHHPDLAFAARAMCRVERTAEPRGGLRSYYDDRYGEYLRLDHRLAHLFDGSAKAEA